MNFPEEMRRAERWLGQTIGEQCGPATPTSLRPFAHLPTLVHLAPGSPFLPAGLAEGVLITDSSFNDRGAWLWQGLLARLQGGRFLFNRTTRVVPEPLTAVEARAFYLEPLQDGQALTEAPDGMLPPAGLALGRSDPSRCAITAALLSRLGVDRDRVHQGLHIIERDYIANSSLELPAAVALAGCDLVPRAIPRDIREAIDTASRRAHEGRVSAASGGPIEVEVEVEVKGLHQDWSPGLSRADPRNPLLRALAAAVSAPERNTYKLPRKHLKLQVICPSLPGGQLVMIVDRDAPPGTFKAAPTSAPIPPPPKPRP